MMETRNPLSFKYAPYLIALCAFCLGPWAATAYAQEETPAPYVFMTTVDMTGVHRSSNKNTAVYAKVAKNAVVKVRLHRKMSDCPKGWYERAEGGFICGSHLLASDARAEQPAGEDVPNLREGLAAVAVTVPKTGVYKKRNSFLRGHADAVLLKGSVLVVVGETQRQGTRFLQTRQGWFVAAKDCTPLPSEITTLAVDVSDRDTGPGAVVIGRDTQIFQAPDAASPQIGILPRWSYISGATTGSFEAAGEFVKLPSGGYVRDASLARFRPAPLPPKALPNERWVAVDLEEQLLTVYEGDKPIRIMPCSTGVRDNTYKGQYTISRKLKQQTMQLRMCRIRVEDVQWVMYYDEAESIAIHSAYWHDNFGTKVSHGCVNLPPDDAKWLFEWTAPNTALTDTVTLPLPRGSGTNVVVF